MSSITNAVIIVEYACDELLEQLTKPLEFDVERNQKFEQIDMSNAGGTKYFTQDVYAAAFNYVNSIDIIAWFKKLHWCDSNSAVLVLTYEYDEFPTVVRVYGNEMSQM